MKGGISIFEAIGYIKYIGFGLILLGLSYFVGIMNLELFSIFSFSISGFMFIIGDFFDHKYDKAEKNNNNSDMKLWDRSKKISSFLGIIFISFIPYFHPNISTEYLDKLNNAVLLFGLGITVLLIGLKSDEKVIGTINKFSYQFETLIKENEKLKFENNELKQKINESKNI